MRLRRPCWHTNLSLGVFALEDALAHGRPYAAAASQLARSAPEDELVASACQALPQDAADRVSHSMSMAVLHVSSLASGPGLHSRQTFGAQHTDPKRDALLSLDKQRGPRTFPSFSSLCHL